ncbi:MAG: RagB/SusD family nutrient uptake outer membrane protein [Arachidicoccus sp.]|nr:RagB/SusD family nutrient uptake outer membrane protein [Arachidicoccus sp.]
MKRNKILYGAALLINIFTISACSKSFLEPTPKGQALETTYYSTPNQAFAGLVAAYGPMGITYHDGYTSSEGLANAASDECYSGGASANDQITWTAMNNMKLLTPAVMPNGLWDVAFQGVSASNLLLSKLDGAGLDQATLARYTAEAKFLRAYYYFHLVRWFGNVPLFTSAASLDEVYAVKQSAPSDVYTQIEKDLNDAIPDLPVTVSPSDYGRATQGTAKSLLGKVDLYDKKYAEAATVLKDVNGTPGGTSEYGYHLMDNYGDIFTQKFNAEAILEIQHSSSQKYGDWSGNVLTGNMYAVMCGPRNYTFKTAPAPTIVTGWGFTPVSYDLVDAMVVNGNYDPRYKYTIYNIDSFANAGLCSYSATPFTLNFPYTGYNVAKFAPLQQFKGSGGNDYLNYGVDYIEIRLADTYLMEAEALIQGNGDKSRAQQLLDAVRSRVGLPSVAVTLDAIKNERHLELATEGHRFFDLVRWGDADKVLNNMEKGYSKNFVTGKNEILPIPLAEFANTQMVQNPGYNH